MTEIGKPIENPERDVQPTYDPVPREVPIPAPSPQPEREPVPAGVPDRSAR